jgi:hypothetical protein
MLNVTEVDLQVKKEYYKDQMRAAQRYNRAKALLGSDRGQRPVAWALTWLGGQLADWGKSLQERYGTVVSPTLPQPR